MYNIKSHSAEERQSKPITYKKNHQPHDLGSSDDQQKETTELNRKKVYFRKKITTRSVMKKKN